jgi:DNA-binding response OmpR family regulator
MTPQRVLIIDDDLMTAKITSLSLERLGHNTTVREDDWANAAEGVNWDDYDAVIVDRHLGTFDGMGILEWLCEHQPRVKRILLTVDSSTPDLPYVEFRFIKPSSTAMLAMALESDR